jgi:hypothetical protein
MTADVANKPGKGSAAARARDFEIRRQLRQILRHIKGTVRVAAKNERREVLPAKTYPVVGPWMDIVIVVDKVYQRIPYRLLDSVERYVNRRSRRRFQKLEHGRVHELLFRDAVDISELHSIQRTPQRSIGSDSHHQRLLPA